MCAVYLLRCCMTLLALWRSGFLVSGVRGLVFKCEVVGRTERVGRARYRGSRPRQPSRAQLFLALAWRRRWLAARARFRCMAGMQRKMPPSYFPLTQCKYKCGAIRSYYSTARVTRAAYKLWWNILDRAAFNAIRPRPRRCRRHLDGALVETLCGKFAAQRLQLRRRD